MGRTAFTETTWETQEYGRIILRWIFRKWDVGYGLDRAGSGYGQVAGICECCNELLGSIKSEEILV